jgi:hypothetical protein
MADWTSLRRRESETGLNQEYAGAAGRR